MFKGTKLIWTGNLIASWTNLSVCRGTAEGKTCRRLSTSIWEEEDDNPFYQTKPRSALFSIDI
jgi:hypothetical protein